MRKEKKSASSDDKKKDLVLKLSRLSIDDNVFEGSTDLPQVFQVRLSRQNLKRFALLNISLISVYKYKQSEFNRVILYCMT